MSPRKRKTPTARELAAARRVLEAHGEATRATEAAVKAQHIGRAFKYRNNYSLPKDDSERWWCYRMPLRLDGTSLVGLEFQRDYRGKIEFNPEAYCDTSVRGSMFAHGWLEIAPTEFWAEARKLLRAVEQLVAPEGNE